MISINELKRIAAQNSVALSVIEKDYALTWILCALAETKYQKYLIFKGGTALRKSYFEDWRYSEDLDFTATRALSESELKEFIKIINAYLSDKSGLSISIKSLHLNKEYAQLKIQFIGPLQHENTIKLDFSFNEKIVSSPEEKNVISEYSDQEKHQILVYPLEEILAEKIRSILQRGKTRDYYDVWKILKFHFSLINKDRVRTILNQKCLFKNLTCNGDLLFEATKISEAKEYWDKGLAHQVNKLPEFDVVISECKDLLKPILK